MAIYGVIMAIILQGKIGDQCSECKVWGDCNFAAYALFWTGISVGFSNLFCGYKYLNEEFVWAYLALDVQLLTLKILIPS